MNQQDLPTIDYLLRVVWSSVSKMYNDKAKHHNFTMVSGFTLLSIDPKSGTPSTSLGPKMGVGATSLSRILKKLEEENLIYRKHNETDRRIVYICLTEKGKEYRNYSKQMVLKFNNALYDIISEEKMNTFREVMDTINNFAHSNTLELNLEKK